ncbi:MAG: universal stress protein [Pseudomonadota bacterium]
MFKTLLLAVDVNDLDGAGRSTEAAVALATQNNAVLHLVNVVPDQGMAIVSAAMTSGHDTAMVEAAHTALSDWANAHVPEGLSTELHVAKGTVYDQIIRLSEDLKVDCIVIGAHSPALKDYLIGPNAARVARHANQSVFVVR